MKRSACSMAVAMAGAIAGATAIAGCDKATIDPADASKPVAELLVKQGDGQYAIANQATLGSGGLVKVLCRVRDPQGVKQARLSFQGGSSGSCTVSGSVFNGSFPLQPPLPSPMVQNIGGADGKAPTTVPLFADVVDAKCTVFGQPQPGRPLGHTIVAKCEGTNWSSNPANQTASAQLQIQVQ